MTYEEFKKFEEDLKEKVKIFEEEREKWVQIEITNSYIEDLENDSIKSVVIYLKDSKKILEFDGTDFIRKAFIKFLELRKENLLNEGQ